jgi:hypothetical protein
MVGFFDPAAAAAAWRLETSGRNADWTAAQEAVKDLDHELMRVQAVLANFGEDTNG